MQIYIADLDSYNSGYLKGEWIQLPADNKDLKMFAHTWLKCSTFKTK